MPSTSRPILTIQTASLFASGDASTFIGTGGPAYDPWLATFDGVVSSGILANNPFIDQLANVDAGDQIVFVIAVQNFANDSAAYNIKLRNVVPVGFAIPTGGADVVVTDGAGKILDSSGNLFDPAGGLVIGNALGQYSDSSGANVALVTFTLQATSSIAVPHATLTSTAQIVSFAASSGGANLAASNPSALTASTPVQTSGITVTSTANQPATPLGTGQTASFDITVTLPEGTIGDLRITEALPLSGLAGFSLVSAQIVQFGANLNASLPVTAQPDGSILLGAVRDTYDNLQTQADQLTVRVTVTPNGGSAGTGTLQTTVSTTDPDAPGQRWSTTVTNTLALATPDVAPTIAGVSPNQHTTNTAPVLPFAGLVLTDPDAGQTQTLTIHLSSRALGTLSGAAGLTVNGAGDYVLTGPVAAVQASARSLTFTPGPGNTGTETFTLTVNDGAGGAASDSRTAVTVAAAANPSNLAQFPISQQTVLTSTVTGSTTFVPLQSYLGPIDNIQSQFLYDGSAPLAIVAQQSNLLVSTKASATAVQLAGGSNVVNVEQGSGFITSGSGSDVFILHADQAQSTWNTMLNFHSGDSITVYGFNPSSGSRYWDTIDGAPGYTGATLRLDVNRDSRIDSSITFAGKTATDVSRYSVTTGNVGGADYLLIIAN